jgi:hypothetical protein
MVCALAGLPGGTWQMVTLLPLPCPPPGASPLESCAIKGLAAYKEKRIAVENIYLVFIAQKFSCLQGYFCPTPAEVSCLLPVLYMYKKNRAKRFKYFLNLLKKANEAWER